MFLGEVPQLVSEVGPTVPLKAFLVSGYAPITAFRAWTNRKLKPNGHTFGEYERPRKISQTLVAGCD